MAKPRDFYNVFVLIVSLFATGCLGDRSDWNRAQETNTIASYEDFLARHHESSFVQQAVDRIWALTEKENSRLAYEEFLAKHVAPSDEAAKSRAIQGAWRVTVEKNDVSTYEAFLDEHSSTSYAQPAIEAVWKLVDAAPSVATYDAFLQKHGDSPLAEQAKAHVRDLWLSVVPGAPTCALTGNLTVSVRWQPIAGAKGYIVETSPSKAFPSRTTKKTSANGIFLDYKDRVGSYSARLPVYIRVTALHGDTESQPSEACVAKLLPSHDGTICQVCGAKAVGYCHLREIYVCSSHDTFTDDNGTHWRCP